MKKFIPLFLFLHTFLFCVNVNVCGYVSLNYSHRDFISFQDSGFYSSYLYVKKDFGDVENSFVVYTTGTNYFVPQDNFIFIDRCNIYFPLMKMNFPFLEMKENVLPYLHPNFVIKLLFMLNKTNNNIRISDAMRTTEDQVLYKKRGWTDVLASPHIIGLAIDLSYYSGTVRNTILKYHKSLRIRYLEHGNKYNKHIHLQDDEIWTPIKEAGEEIITESSDDLSREISFNNHSIKSNGIEYLKKESTGILYFEFFSESQALVKILFESNLGEKQAEILSGVFEHGENTLFVNYDFLKKGVYRVKFYVNNFFVEERIVVRY